MTAEFDLSGFGLRLTGDDALIGQLSEQWAPFRGVAPRLVLEIAVERAVPGAWSHDRERGGRPSWIEGGIQLRGPRTALLQLADGEPSRRLWGAINLVMQALGSAVVEEGGLLVHAAGAVLEDRAFLLPGASGTGKSTWARACAAAGLPVLSDDVVLLDVSGETPAALGSPLRTRDFPAPGRGRWPLAGLLLARHGAPGLARVPALRLQAVLQASVLFASAHDDRVPKLLDRLGARVPARQLTFAPDPSFVPLLRSFDAAAR